MNWKLIIWQAGMWKKVVHALVSASKANIELSFQMATGIDLAGRDVFGSRANVSEP